MSAARRSKMPEAPDAPQGYRQTRRGSAGAKAAKRAERSYAVQSAVARTQRGARNVLIVIVQGIMTVLIGAIVFLLAATAINTYVRWQAVRQAEKAASPSEKDRRAKENVLVIGVDGDNAVGFLAMRVDADRKQVFGIAIPEGAFIDVPGQGFVRMGEAYPAGADAVSAAVSNYLGVPFNSYFTVPGDSYRDALKRQVVVGLPELAKESNLTTADLTALSRRINKIEPDKVALVPLPVKPIKLGEQTYLEPQKDQVADLLKSWWGVDPNKKSGVVRVVVFNGSGVPGVAGTAAQQLIRAGFRVVDTQNADNFKYKQTKIIVRRGGESRGEAVKKVLGAGVISVDPSQADVTDVVIIIGSDYTPPKSGAKKGN